MEHRTTEGAAVIPPPSTNYDEYPCKLRYHITSIFCMEFLIINVPRPATIKTNQKTQERKPPLLSMSSRYGPIIINRGEHLDPVELMILIITTSMAFIGIIFIVIMSVQLLMKPDVKPARLSSQPAIVSPQQTQVVAPARPRMIPKPTAIARGERPRRKIATRGPVSVGK